MKLRYFTAVVYDFSEEVTSPWLLSKSITVTTSYRPDVSTLTAHELNFNPGNRFFWTPFAFIYVPLACLVIGAMLLPIAVIGLNWDSLAVLPFFALVGLFVFGFGISRLKECAIMKKMQHDYPELPTGAVLLQFKEGSPQWHQLCSKQKAGQQEPRHEV